MNMTRPKNPTLEQLNAYADHLEERTKELQKQNKALLTRQRVLEENLQLLREQILLGRRHRFGRSSERTHPNQVSMLETMAEAFNEAAQGFVARCRERIGARQYR